MKYLIATEHYSTSNFTQNPEEWLFVGMPVILFDGPNNTCFFLFNNGEATVDFNEHRMKIRVEEENVYIVNELPE